ncbi:MAG: hypothetical protein QOJ81_362 [Chloroflexota bacterium]|jgi:hypothetical protein|nr:hypothetical protein [Chloroflexota bacterium]
MSVDALLTAAIGAFFGASGWLLVGLYMQRRQAQAQARNAARAVYFELAMNSIDVKVAADHLVFQPLRRQSFDRLLPELATWLEAEDLETIVRAYMTHAGYEQAQRDDKLPAPVRMAVLNTVLAQHRGATDLLRVKAFSERERARLSTSSEPGGSAAPAQSVTSVARNA